MRCSELQEQRPIMNKNFSGSALRQGDLGLPSLAQLAAKNPAFLDEVLLPKEASAVIKVPVSTLATLRHRGGGPKFVRLGPGKRAPCGYTRRYLYEWTWQQTRSSTSDSGQAV